MSEALPAAALVHLPTCPLCGGASYRTLMPTARDRLARKEGVFAIASCAGCGLVATRPQPLPDRLGYYYEDVYSGAGAAVARTVQAGFIGRWIARYRVRAVRRHVSLGPASRLLEVGCGYGSFLAALQRATGCQAIGLDTDAGSLAGALDRDRIDYRCAGLASAGLPPASLDAIVLFQSLEHHTEPVAALRQAHALLKPGGCCVVEVPDFDGGWRRVFGSWWLPLLVPQHLFHFTPRTLRRSFEAAGFEVPAGHRSMFYPAESTASLGLWLNERLGRPLRRFRLRPARPDGVLLLALLAAWWLLVEVPVQAVLVLAGRSGHQLMVGRKP